MPTLIEETVCSESLPVNSIAMLNRLKQLLEENQTNCLADICGNDSVQKVMWLLMGQVFGHLSVIDMTELWGKLCHKTEV